MLLGQSSDMRLSVFLLSAPAVLPHIGYLFAQPDVTLNLLLLLCLYAFLNTSPIAAARISVPLCCIALLAHEAFSLMFYPLIVAILLHLCRTRRLPWAIGIAHVAIVFCAFATIVHFGTLKVSADTILAEASARTDVGIQRQVYDVMASTFGEQQALVHTVYSPIVLRVLAITLVLSLPYFWRLIGLLRRAMSAARKPSLDKVLTVTLFLSHSSCAL